MLIDALHAALEDTEVTFNCVRLRLARHVFVFAIVERVRLGKAGGQMLSPRPRPASASTRNLARLFREVSWLHWELNRLELRDGASTSICSLIEKVCLGYFARGGLNLTQSRERYRHYSGPFSARVPSPTQPE